MCRLMSTAPLIISTLYNGLWSDSRSGHFTKLCTHAPQEQQFFRHPVILGTLSVCFYAKQGTRFLLKKRAALTAHTNVEPLPLCLGLLLQEICLWCELRIGIFLLWIPLLNPPGEELRHLVTVILHTRILLVKTEKGLENGPNIHYC